MDTSVDTAFNGDTSGYLRRASVWQYKSGGWEETEPAKLRELLNKAYLKARLLAGDALRICVCECKPDTLVSSRTQELVDLMRNELKLVPSPEAHPQILTPDSLAVWASRFPAVVDSSFGPRVNGCLHADAWFKSIRRNTPKFVSDAARDAVKRALHEHVQLNLPLKEVIKRVFGPAGVGKTRLVCEALDSAPVSVRSLILYCFRESDAYSTAVHLANSPELSAVLVADECTATTRHALEELLKGHCDRTRIIAIDNRAERSGGPQPEPWIGPLGETELGDVLQQNYGGRFSADQIRAILRLTEGYVRFAIDLCENPLDPIPASIPEYIERRFHDRQNELSVLGVLALVTHVGYQGEERSELDALRGAVWPDGTMPSDRFLRVANSLHDGCGFVGRGEFLFVTPEIIARALVRIEWARSVVSDPHRFFDQLSACPDLLERLSRRLARTPGLEKECAELGAYFRQVVESLKPADVTQAVVARRVCSMIEADPSTLLPELRKALDRLDIDQLRAIHGNSRIDRAPEDPHWGPRRYFVWTCEKLSTSERFFEDASAILLRLAAGESETGIGNNASAIWRQVNRIMLSGTEVPYKARLQILEEHFKVGPDWLKPMVLEALDEALDRPDSRLVIQGLVGGEPPHEEWSPKNDSEWHEQEERALDFLGRIIAEGGSLAAEARRIVAEHVSRLVLRGHAGCLRSLLSEPSLEEKARLISNLRHALEFAQSGSTLRTSIEDWLATIEPKTLLDKVKALAALHAWNEGDQARIEEVARELAHDSGAVETYLDLLAQTDAPDVCARVGEMLARYDADSRWLTPLLRDVISRRQSTAIARGYLHGWREARRDPSRVLPFVDQAAFDPRLEAELALLAGPEANALKRMVESIAAGRLPTMFLANLEFAVRRCEVDVGGMIQALEALRSSEEPRRLAIAVRLLEAWLQSRRKTEEAFGDSYLRSLAWDILTPHLDTKDESSLRREPPADAYAWGDVVQELGRYDPRRAIRLVLDVVLGRLHEADELQSALGSLINRDPALALEELAQLMIGPRKVVFFLGSFRKLVQLWPIEDWKRELAHHGLALAQSLARQLPPPQRDGHKSTMPELTRWVLARFGEDQRVYREFCTGIHGWESWAGNVSDKACEGIEVARAFLDDPDAIIRRWAREEIESQEAMRRQWLRREERDEFHPG